MSSTSEVYLPNEIIHQILLYCQSPADYLSQLLINRQWFSEADLLQPMMKRRFARELNLPTCRSIMWDYDRRLTVIGRRNHIQRHGLEECVQTYHRVGGPSCEVYYLERYWQDGKLYGEEILREINSVWYQNRSGIQLDESIEHPYEGIAAVDSMRQHGRHCAVAKDSPLPEGCDYLGRILFRHQWIDGTLEESQQLQRFSEDGDSIANLYEIADRLDLSLINNVK